MVNSNLKLAHPFIIHTPMRHSWGWDAVNCPNQSKLTQPWCEKWITAKPTLTPHMTEKQVVVTILEPIYQSPPSPITHYTYNEKLEGLRCCEILALIQTYSILVWNVGYTGAKIVTTHDSKAGVRWWLWIVNSNLKLAHPFIILIHSQWDMLGLRRCELPQSVQTHSKNWYPPHQPPY